jgi:hypothetical protein
MPESATDTTQTPAPDAPTTEAPASEPQTLDEWVDQNPAPDAGAVDLEDDAQQDTSATPAAQPQGEEAVYAALREQLTQVVSHIKGGNQPNQPAAQPAVQAATQPQADGVGGDEWADAHNFLTNQETGLGYTPEEAKGFTKAMSGPISAIERRIEAKMQRFEVLAAQYEQAQQTAREEAIFKVVAAQPGAAEIYGTADKKNTEAFEMTKLNAAIIQSMAQAKGINLTDEQALAQAHKVLYFDKFNKQAAKGTVPAVAANRTRTLAAQAARGTSQPKQNGQQSSEDELSRFVNNAKSDPISRALGFTS